MRHLPPQQVQALVRFAREIAKCECGGVLDFTTNQLGGVVEICQSCKNVRPMQRAARVELLPKDPVETWECPERCGKTVTYAGRGPRRRRCPECQSARDKATSSERKKWKPTKGAAA